MDGNFSDIRCPSCGSPAQYDIVKGKYLCRFCGGKVSIHEAHAQKQGFRSIQQIKIKESSLHSDLVSSNCSSCGARIIFENREALSKCDFCGSALVREEFLVSEDFPELIIPFRITEDEARKQLEDWCSKNSSKIEAKNIRAHMGKLKGFYLPYELIRGPVSCRISRMDCLKTYECRGYVDNVFVNCSKQLDNMLLDGMEPYELDDLKEFDFSFVAGLRVKMGDLNADELKRRVETEVANDYSSVVQKTLETKAVSVHTNANSVFRMPILLPVYSICAGNSMVAVNGQTGKVSVRAEKASNHYFIPWWGKAMLSTLIIVAAAYGGFRLFGWNIKDSLYFAGILAVITIIVTLTAYSDTVKNRFKVESIRKIFTSSHGPLRRVGNELLPDKSEIKKDITPPVFFEELHDGYQPVVLRFTSPLRLLKVILLSLIVFFLPVIVALFINGFDFERLEIAGSAVWFCIAVPTIPIYILKFARIDLYERPWIYRILENGEKKRYRKKSGSIINKEVIAEIFKLLFRLRISFLIWFIVLIFIAICYITAFGFD